MDDKTYKLIKTVFKTTKKAPSNFKELMKLYVGMVRHVGGNNLVVSKQVKTRKAQRDEVVYNLDEVVRDYHLELNSQKNKQMNDFIDVELIAKFVKPVPVNNDLNLFLDNDEEDVDDDLDEHENPLE